MSNTELRAEEKIYKAGILKMLSCIHNVEWLRKIYSFTKVFAENAEGGE